jgi:hypothetical protein
MEWTAAFVFWQDAEKLGRTAYFAARDHAVPAFRDGEIGVNPQLSGYKLNRLSWLACSAGSILDSEFSNRLEMGVFQKPSCPAVVRTVKTGFDPELFLGDREEHISADGHPDLSLDSVFRTAIEGLDPQILLDPLEEHLDIPAALVEFGDRQRGQREVVG